MYKNKLELRKETLQDLLNRLKTANHPLYKNPLYRLFRNVHSVNTPSKDVTLLPTHDDEEFSKKMNEGGKGNVNAFKKDKRYYERYVKKFPFRQMTLYGNFTIINWGSGGGTQTLWLHDYIRSQSEGRAELLSTREKNINKELQGYLERFLNGQQSHIHSNKFKAALIEVLKQLKDWNDKVKKNKGKIIGSFYKPNQRKMITPNIRRSQTMKTIGVTLPGKGRGRGQKKKVKEEGDEPVDPLDNRNIYAHVLKRKGKNTIKKLKF
tara:strand:- start:1432 stop:2226 length:795 start_codon:yes stop_codon:yes gene_type:complete